MSSKSFAFVAELADILRDFLVRDGMTKQQATEKGREAAEQLSDKFAGNKIYFPRDRKRMLIRNEQIYAAHVYGKQSFAIVAKHAGISPPMACRIVKAMRKEFAKKK